MKTKSNSMSIPSKNIVRIFVATGLILLIPLIAMQFSDEWDWKLFDFIVIGTLLVGAGTAYELIASRLKNSNQRLVALALVVIVVMLIWAELAVGLVETFFAGS